MYYLTNITVYRKYCDNNDHFQRLVKIEDGDLRTVGDKVKKYLNKKYEDENINFHVESFDTIE